MCTSSSLKEEHLLHMLWEQNRQLENDTKCLTSLGEEDTLSRSNDSETEERAVAWLDVIKKWDGSARKKLKSQVNALIDQGVPNDLRALIWMVLANDSNKSHLRLKYPELIEQSSPCEKLIRRDISRTYPEHKFFKEQGQEALYNVIKAYSLHDREVGYCQGSPFIVGILLLQMPEEEAFCVLVELMESYKMREFFKPSMRELSLNLYVLNELIQEHIPALHTHFKAQGFHPTTYASQWFLTMFATVLPLSCIFRIMDIFLWEQTYDIIFQVGLSLLKEGEKYLLQQDIEGMLQYFRSMVYKNYVGADDELIKNAREIRIDQKKLKRMKNTYTNEKEKESAELEECKRLSFENSVLIQRIRSLEEETSHLADKLIRGQVSRAEQAEEMFIVKRELVAVKRHDMELSNKLKEATRRVAYLDSKLHSICAENEALREAVSELGRDPVQYLENTELPNVVYSSEIALPHMASSAKEVECDASFCTLERQESMDVSPNALEMMAGTHDPLAVQDLGKQVARRMSLQNNTSNPASASNKNTNGTLPSLSSSKTSLSGSVSSTSSTGGTSPTSIPSSHPVCDKRLPNGNLNNRSGGYYASNTQYDGGTLVQSTELSAFGTTSIGKEKSSLSDSIKKGLNSIW